MIWLNYAMTFPTFSSYAQLLRQTTYYLYVGLSFHVTWNVVPFQL